MLTLNHKFMSPRKKNDNRLTGSRKRSFLYGSYWISKFKKIGMVELLLSYTFNIIPFSELKILFSCYVLKKTLDLRDM